jgi:hypothetical protein
MKKRLIIILVVPAAVVLGLLMFAPPRMYHRSEWVIDTSPSGRYQVLDMANGQPNERQLFDAKTRHHLGFVVWWKKSENGLSVEMSDGRVMILEDDD